MCLFGLIKERALYNQRRLNGRLKVGIHVLVVWWVRDHNNLIFKSRTLFYVIKVLQFGWFS